MSPQSNRRRTSLVLTTFFVALAAVLEGSLALYWKHNLEPGLTAATTSQASVLAHSQAALLLAALNVAPERQRAKLREALDQLMLLRDPDSGEPFFVGVALEFDYSALRSAHGSLDLAAGTASGGAIRFAVPLYNQQSDELVGIANFSVNSNFQQRFITNARKELVIQGTVMFGLITASWALLLWLLAKLERSQQLRLTMERALAENELKFRHLLDALDQYFVYGRDADGRFTSVSASVSRVLPGITPERFLDEYHALLDGPGVGPEIRNLTTPPGPKPAVVEARVPDGKGRQHWIEHTEIPVIEDGRVTGVDGIARDVTQQRRFEEELRHARVQAEQANQAKSQFLANMSHEIRTPMNAVLGMTSLLQKTELTGRQQSLLDQVRSSAHLLLGLLNDILDLSRIEAGKMVFDEVDFSLDSVLTDLAVVVRDRIGDKDIEVLFDVSPDVPRVLRGDPVRLQQVLVNLITNATKFTESGEIVVSAGPAASVGDANVLQFEVRDTGIGIAEVDVERLFEPFTQADESSTRQKGGVGLGLAICRRLVEAMHGEITVESEPGKGSCFRFTAQFGKGRQPVHARPGHAELVGARVLVVDDNSTARSIFSSMLDALRFDVETVDSGAAALERIDAATRNGAPYRLVLADWKMPGMDGVELVSHLRGSALPSAPATVLVSAYGGYELDEIAEREKIQVLHKPVSQSTLYEAVVAALGLHPGVQHRQVRAAAHGMGIRPGARVLVVEDNEINREVAFELIRACGLEVTTAANGTEALHKAAGGRFDIIFMDVQMPDMDGMEATRRLKADPALRSIPVVALTAHAMIGDRQRCLDAGMDDYLSKPIIEQELQRVLARWLGTAPKDSLAAAPGAPPGPVIRGIGLDQALERVNGNTALLHRLLLKFQGGLNDSVDRIAAAIAAGDTAGAISAAHALKGESATLAVDRVSAACVRLEKELRAGRPADELLPELRRAARDFVQTDLSTLRPEGENTDAARALPLEEIRGLVQRLHALLLSNSMEAVYHFDAIRAHLAPYDDPGIDRLRDQIHGLDFPAASATVEGLLDGALRAAPA